MTIYARMDYKLLYLCIQCNSFINVNYQFYLKNNHIYFILFLTSDNWKIY
jgi:hypothetical protein